MVAQQQSLNNLSAEQLREMVASLMGHVTAKDAQIVRHQTELKHSQALNAKLTHENALLKRMKFAAQSERFNAQQRSLLEDEIEADLAAVAVEIEQLQPPAAAPEAKQQPKRQPLPAHLPRREIRHEPESTTCACGCQMKRIGENVAEKLDYVPGVFTVERHIRGKWACAQCETITQTPVDAHVIDKGIATAGLLTQVLVAKYADHLPLYRQEAIFARAGLAIPRLSLAQWVGTCGVRLQPLVDALKAEILSRRVQHADEMPVQMLKPGKGATHRAYLWAYAPGAFEDIKAVVYDFCESRAGELPATSWAISAAAWYATTSVGTKRGSLKTLPKLAAWRTLGANSLTCMRPTKASLPGSRWSSSARSMTSSVRSRIWAPISARAFGSSMPNRCLMHCTSGWRCSVKNCRTAPPQPGPWITASGAG